MVHSCDLDAGARPTTDYRLLGLWLQSVYPNMEKVNQVRGPNRRPSGGRG